MAKTKYIVKLTNEEYERLKTISQSEEESERTILRATILMMSDVERNEKLSVTKLADRLGTTTTTMKTDRTEYAASGLEAAVYRKKRTPGFINKRINEEAIEKILRMREETPPAGKKRWSVRLLCDEAARRGIVTHIAPSTMSGILNQFSENKE